jgi:putative hydroxymethylpyrimidine transport system substrate-binding protein
MLAWFLFLTGAVSSRAEPPDTLVLMLDWYVNANHAPVLHAQASGAYAARGISLQVQEPADPNDPPKLAAAGKVDLAISYQPQAMMLIGKGVPITRISALVPSPLNSVMTLADGPVRTIKDLKGRKVGYSVSGFEDALLTGMLAHAGVPAETVTLVNVNFSLAPALLSGQTDAVIGAFRNYETHQLTLKGKAVRVFPVEAHGVPPYEELIFVANRARAKDETLRTFADVTAQAAQALARDPDAAWSTIVRANPKLDDELNRRAYRDTVALYARSVASPDPKAFAAFARFLTDRGLTPKPVALSDYAP